MFKLLPISFAFLFLTGCVGTIDMVHGFRGEVVDEGSAPLDGCALSVISKKTLFSEKEIVEEMKVSARFDINVTDWRRSTSLSVEIDCGRDFIPHKIDNLDTYWNSQEYYFGKIVMHRSS